MRLTFLGWMKDTVTEDVKIYLFSPLSLVQEVWVMVTI